MRLKNRILITVVMVVFGTPVSAAEPEFGVTAEFLSVCNDFSSANQAAESFLEAGWSEEGAEFRDALSPDDFLKKVKRLKAFSVELDNGGKWLAATAEARMGKTRVIYCSITSIDSDPDGYRQDFEMATGLEPTNSVSYDIEDRKVYEVAENEIYVMREVRTPENGFFTYVRLSPKSAE